MYLQVILGGSWVVISGVIRPLIWVLSIVTLPITLLITTHEPPSSGKPTTQIPAYSHLVRWASPRKASALQQEYLGSSPTWGPSAVPKTVCLQQVNNQNSNSIGNQSHNDPINENCAP